MTSALLPTGVRIKAGTRLIDADLVIPPNPAGLVVFAHGSGSSRTSPRNRAVAAALEAGGFATLLVDLLTAHEDAIDRHTREYRFDIPRLGTRVVAAVDWAAGVPALAGLPIICFGASTGAAAALIAAAERPDIVTAVVSRGGRPDLAGDALGAVHAPTLLIVGEQDPEVIALNRLAQTRVHAPTRLAIVAGATHLFEEAGALEQVCALALEWCREHSRKAVTS